MPIFNFVKECKIKKTARLMQLEGLFDVGIPDIKTVNYSVDLPIETFDWNVDLIYGPSGSGKTSIAREVFKSDIVSSYEWSADKSLIDDFPPETGIKNITELLSSVGFSSPPKLGCAI
jgi:ABC-type molybdenum transport system ATPase subunit/photorepair protein PhrA